MAKWLRSETLKLLILDHPLRGLDPAPPRRSTRRSVAPRRGHRIVLLADTLEEDLEMDDTILVMRDGEFTARFDPPSTLPRPSTCSRRWCDDVRRNVQSEHSIRKRRRRSGRDCCSAQRRPAPPLAGHRPVGHRRSVGSVHHPVRPGGDPAAGVPRRWRSVHRRHPGHCDPAGGSWPMLVCMWVDRPVQRSDRAVLGDPVGEDDRSRGAAGWFCSSCSVPRSEPSMDSWWRSSRCRASR